MKQLYWANEAIFYAIILCSKFVDVESKGILVFCFICIFIVNCWPDVVEELEGVGSKRAYISILCRVFCFILWEIGGLSTHLHGWEILLYIAAMGIDIGFSFIVFKNPAFARLTIKEFVNKVQRTAVCGMEIFDIHIGIILTYSIYTGLAYGESKPVILILSMIFLGVIYLYIRKLHKSFLYLQKKRDTDRVIFLLAIVSIAAVFAHVNRWYIYAIAGVHWFVLKPYIHVKRES